MNKMQWIIGISFSVAFSNSLAKEFKTITVNVPGEMVVLDKDTAATKKQSSPKILRSDKTVKVKRNSESLVNQNGLRPISSVLPRGSLK